MLRIAFKEWAAVCRALAVGRQAIILRKGGIAETGGQFEPEHTRFWLYPTYVHQQQGGLKPDAAELVHAAEADRPPAGIQGRLLPRVPGPGREVPARGRGRPG